MKRIRVDHEWYELRGARIRVSREVRDCDMAEHTGRDWQAAIQPGDIYAWMSHGLNVCSKHFTPEDITDG